MTTRPANRPEYRYSLESRALVLCTGFVLLLTGLSVRLLHLQHTKHSEVMAKLIDELDKTSIPARRGDILDRDRRPLATTEPVSELVLDKYQIPFDPSIHKLAIKHAGMSSAELGQYDDEQTKRLYYQMLATRLARPLKREVQELAQRLIDGKKEYIVQKGVDSQVAREVVQSLERDGFKGLRYRDSMQRAYVSEELACHVLGYVYHGLDGAEGIEASMNGFLKGRDGAQYFDPEGKFVSEEQPEHGRHVVLTLDATFQDIVEKIVDRHYRELRAAAITAVFAEPISGEVLALVNRPGFRPADGGNAAPRTRWNMAAASQYEPGSTFKLVTLGAAMDMGLVSLDDWVECHDGYYKEPGWEKALEDSAKARCRLP